MCRKACSWANHIPQESLDRVLKRVSTTGIPHFLHANQRRGRSSVRRRWPLRECAATLLPGAGIGEETGTRHRRDAANALPVADSRSAAAGQPSLAPIPDAGVARTNTAERAWLSVERARFAFAAKAVGLCASRAERLLNNGGASSR